MLRLWVILLFLLLGMLISIIVAMSFVSWGLEEWYAYDYTKGLSRDPTAADMQLWKKYSTQKWRDSIPQVEEYSFLGRKYTDLVAIQDDGALVKGNSVVFHSDLWETYPNYQITQGHLGWPFLCLKMNSWGENIAYRRVINSGHDMYVVNFEITFPTRIHVGGMFGNSLLFGGSAWIFVWLTLFNLSRCRSYFRRAKGLCPQCKYELKAQVSPGCPECGWNRP